MTVGNPIDRSCRSPGTQALTDTLSTTPAIDYGPFAGGQITIEAAATITLLTWSSSPTKTGTFTPCHDSAGAAVTQAVTHTKAYPIPDALFGCKFLKCVVDNDGNVEITGKT